MPWIERDSAVLPNGDVMTLRQNDEAFEIRIGLTELMSSKNPLSEQAMAEAVVARMPTIRRALIGGLGMGFTARAMLDACGARVVVAELVPAVVAWNRGVLADLAGRPLDDPRLTVFEGDVAAAMRANPGGFDVILLDVDNGPEAVLFEGNGALYSAEGVALARSALAPGGVLCVWAADPSPRFEQVLAAASAATEKREIAVTGRVGHTLYVVQPGP